MERVGECRPLSRSCGVVVVVVVSLLGWRVWVGTRSKEAGGCW